MTPKKPKRGKVCVSVRPHYGKASVKGIEVGKKAMWGTRTIPVDVVEYFPGSKDSFGRPYYLESFLIRVQSTGSHFTVRPEALRPMPKKARVKK